MWRFGSHAQAERPTQRPATNDRPCNQGPEKKRINRAPQRGGSAQAWAACIKMLAPMNMKRTVDSAIAVTTRRRHDVTVRTAPEQDHRPSISPNAAAPTAQRNPTTHGGRRCRPAGEHGGRAECCAKGDGQQPPVGKGNENQPVSNKPVRQVRVVRERLPRRRRGARAWAGKRGKN